MEHNLTPKQLLFCEYYLVHGNGARACRDAGYSHKGANIQASNLLSNEKVQTYLKHKGLMAKKDDVVNKEELLTLISSIARGDGSKGKGKVLDKDRLQAMNILAQHYDMYTPEQVQKEGIKIEIVSAQKEQERIQEEEEQTHEYIN
ncbi:hypothetical protein CN998_01535 [Bacillus cereus]|nr:hypothetical protein CN998_01535 [Bacillus cereus]PGU50711.1 hypothetical protein COD70_29265 [Bacillus cereus]